MNTKHIIVAAMTATAIALTGCPSKSDVPTFHKKLYPGATHAYVFSKKQFLSFYLKHDLTPPMVCTPDGRDLIVATGIIPLGEPLKNHIQKYTDTEIKAYGNPDKAIVLNNSDGTLKEDVPAQIDQKFPPNELRGRANIEACLQSFGKVVDEIIRQQEGEEVSRGKGKLMTQATRSRPTLAS